jgi:outer membrane protein OmpA-like peptidoglycan-associated protein
VDSADGCPQAAEDVDGFEDADGCPDADNDRDGVADAGDACPLEAEAHNGANDEDGCPDQAESPKLVEGKRVLLLGKVHFATDKAEILPRSYKLLEEIATALRGNPQLVQVRVEGHTDDHGADGMNLSLSQRRANTVRLYLINKGIAPERLEAVGYGKTQPMTSNETESGREMNRRVVFQILKVAGETPATAKDVP